MLPETAARRSHRRPHLVVERFLQLYPEFLSGCEPLPIYVARRDCMSGGASERMKGRQVRPGKLAVCRAGGVRVRRRRRHRRGRAPVACISARSPDPGCSSPHSRTPRDRLPTAAHRSARVVEESCAHAIGSVRTRQTPPFPLSWDSYYLFVARWILLPE